MGMRSERLCGLFPGLDPLDSFAAQSGAKGFVLCIPYLLLGSTADDPNRKTLQRRDAPGTSAH